MTVETSLTIIAVSLLVLIVCILALVIAVFILVARAIGLISKLNETVQDVRHHLMPILTRAQAVSKEVSDTLLASVDRLARAVDGLSGLAGHLARNPFRAILDRMSERRRMREADEGR